MSHKATNSTYLPRDDLVAKDKCDAEGAPSETKICLGWNLDTHCLLVNLPLYKYIAWENDLKNFMNKNSISHKDLKSLLGKLEHVITILSMMGHFMNNLYALEIKAAKSIPHNQKIPKIVKEDLQLHHKFLKIANEGISINLLTFRDPNHIIIGDACEHGLGAFHIQSGRAYTWIIPEELKGRAHINLLEFLTQVIQVWLEILENRIKPEDCILALGDNTSSMV